jgi:hypothetical protein
MNTAEALKTDVVFTQPSMKVPDVYRVDTILQQHKIGTIMADDVLHTAKMQRGSGYKVFVAVDLEGKVFGLNKVVRCNSLRNVDGLEFGVSNKSEKEVQNELNSISSFVSAAGPEFQLKVCLNCKHGKEYLDKFCKIYKNYSHIKGISLINTGDETEEFVSYVREKIGNVRLEIKVPHGSLEGNYLKYSININDLA